MSAGEKAVGATEHDKFEQWASTQGFDITRGSRGLYKSLGTNQLLSGWLGRAELANTPARWWAEDALPPEIEGRLQPWLTNGAVLHPQTTSLIVRFARALAAKLAAAEVKYGYSNGWAQNDWLAECRRQLVDHVDKGDPLDVAAYCAFLWHHRANTFSREWHPMHTAPRDGSIIRLLVKFDDHRLEDHQAPQHTIGCNHFDNTEVDEWQFVGWCWAHDHFIDGEGTPFGWLPFSPCVVSAPASLDTAAVRTKVSDQLVSELTPYHPDDLSERDADTMRARAQARWDQLIAIAATAQHTGAPQ